MKFTSFNLKKETLVTLERLSFFDLSPIQEKTLAASLKGESIVAKAPTGSGKTHSFLIPLINRIDSRILSPQAVIIVPTVELGRQTVEFLKDFVFDSPNLTFKFLEDFDFKSKVKSQIVITTPFKLRRLKLEEGLIEFANVKTLVLDEADMLSSAEFFDDIDLITKQIKSTVQYLIFSATYSNDLLYELKKYVSSMNLISIKEGVKNQAINYFAVDIRHQDLIKSIENLFKIIKPYLLLIFAKTTEAVESIAANLQERGYDLIKLHGKMEANERKLSFQRIKENKTRIVVCSDLMARGIDFSNVSDVLSVDIPKDYSFFFHRVGRTARFDKKGNAYLFYNIEMIKEVEELKKLGADFKFLSLFDNELKEKRGIPVFLKNKSKSDPELQKEIKHALSKVKKTQTKPNYKKKAKVAREKAIKKHNQKKLKEKIKKEMYGRKNKNG